MAVDLQKISGLPIFLNKEKLELQFKGDFPFVKKSERSLEELRPYLKNPKANKGPDPVYYVWRYTHLASDNEKINSHNLRYDLTLMPAGMIGGEFVKTAGHYHKPYPEVYEVLIGRAYSLIQSESAVYLAEVGPGEKFIIPPSFGHNTINVFNEPLLIANFVSEKAIYDYNPYKNNRGAMYYFLADGKMIDLVRSQTPKASADARARRTSNGVDIVKNPNYDFVPEIKKIRAKEYPEFGLVKNQPLYSLVNNLEKLRFLNYPEEFAALGW